MLKFSLSVLRFTPIVALVFLPFSQSYAGPIFEMVRSNIDQYGIPYWKRAASEIKTIRNRADTDAYLKQLDNLDTDQSPKSVPELLRKTTTSSDAKELDANMLWLRWKLLSQNADSRFAYTYAYNLSRNHNVNGYLIGEAATFFLLGRLSLTIDGARCADKASHHAALMQIESAPGMRPIVEYLEKLSGSKRAETLMHLVSIEEMRGERKPQVWLCNLGAKSMLQAMDNKENLKVVPSVGQPGSGALVQIDTSKIEPKFIDDDRWREARREILINTIRSVVSAVN